MTAPPSPQEDGPTRAEPPQPTPASGEGAGEGLGAPSSEDLDRAVDQVITPPDADTLAGDVVVAAAELIATRAELAERTDDLRRVQADYANYRKRVERDRALAGELGRAEVLAALVPTLDDVDAARGAGELAGPFGAVAEKLEATCARFGMERYGQVGDPFDPAVHEALMHEVATAPPAAGGQTSPEGPNAANPAANPDPDPANPDPAAAQPAGPTVSLVLQPGYRIDGRVIRPARVGVVEPG